jgi:hypothetical protein
MKIILKGFCYSCLTNENTEPFWRHGRHNESLCVNCWQAYHWRHNHRVKKIFMHKEISANRLRIEQAIKEVINNA